MPGRHGDSEKANFLVIEIGATDWPSAFKFVTGFRETIEASPQEAVGGHDDGGKGDGAGEKHVEVLAIGGGGDHSAYSDGRIGLALEVKVLGHNAGVPGATGGGDHPGDEKGKNSGQN